MPSFYLSAPAAPEILQRFWAEAVDAYLDNPLPSVFKERLIVYLSRFATTRYCACAMPATCWAATMASPAGDRAAAPHGMSN